LARKAGSTASAAMLRRLAESVFFELRQDFSIAATERGRSDIRNCKGADR
jgi:hypothetical protein